MVLPKVNGKGARPSREGGGRRSGQKLNWPRERGSFVPKKPPNLAKSVWRRKGEWGRKMSFPTLRGKHESEEWGVGGGRGGLKSGRKDLD